MLEQGIRHFGWPIVLNKLTQIYYDEKITKTARLERTLAWRLSPDHGNGFRC